MPIVKQRVMPNNAFFCEIPEASNAFKLAKTAEKRRKQAFNAHSFHIRKNKIWSKSPLKDAQKMIKLFSRVIQNNGKKSVSRRK
ncbi:hypothetical protein [Acidaminobacterium chupaoyuni]